MILAVLDTLNVDNATLAGFSMGGAIAIHYMSRHQGSEKYKLVLMGATTLVLPNEMTFSTA